MAPANNDYFESSDSLAPLKKSFTVSEDASVLKAGEFAATRRKNSIRSIARSQSLRQPKAPKAAPEQQSSSTFAPSRSKSLRAPPPPRLQLRRDAEGKLGLPKGARQDFPSPGRAPRGQRIFDPVTIAEDEGVEIAEPGWATDGKSQGKLDKERDHEHGHGHGHGQGHGHGYHAHASGGANAHGKVEEDGMMRQDSKAKGRLRSKSFKDILLRR